MVEILLSASSLYPSVTEEISLTRAAIMEAIRGITNKQQIVENTRMSLTPDDQLQQIKEEVSDLLQ